MKLKKSEAIEGYKMFDADWVSRPVCHNGDTCHEAAPRGSKTGTQGIKGAIDRGVIPELFAWA